jgi:hypothetical protein
MVLRLKLRMTIGAVLATLVCIGAPAAQAAGSGATAASGGVGMGMPASGPSTPAHPTVPGFTAKIIKGVAYAPSYAPLAVKEAIWAGNQIRHKPYIWGGGHSAFKAAGYDCSGSVSYALHAAGLLKTPYDSSDFESWGSRGVGTWITVYTNPSHAFMQIAGIRLDTSAEADPNPAPGSGPRWRPIFHGKPAGFMARHPAAY